MKHMKKNQVSRKPFALSYTTPARATFHRDGPYSIFAAAASRSARFTRVYAYTPPNATAVPTAFTGETAFLKNNTENEITTTLFTQFPTLCVTGETRAKIMYEICWYRWKHAPAIIAF